MSHPDAFEHVDAPAGTGPETRILLLRHAETSAPDRFHGAESDVGLGEPGHQQAADVASRLAALRPAAVYSSALRRARETASPIASSCGVPLGIVEPLHERRMGRLSGSSREASWPLYREAMDRWMAGDLDFTHEGGESYASIRDRVLPAFLDLARSHPGETIVVVAHGVVIRVLLTSLIDGMGPGDFERVAIEFVGINDLRWDGRAWHIAEPGEVPDQCEDLPKR